QVLRPLTRLPRVAYAERRPEGRRFSVAPASDGCFLPKQASAWGEVASRLIQPASRDPDARFAPMEQPSNGKLRMAPPRPRILRRGDGSADQDDLIPALLLGLVHRRVGARHDLVEGFARLCQRNPDAQ